MMRAFKSRVYGIDRWLVFLCLSICPWLSWADGSQNLKSQPVYIGFDGAFTQKTSTAAKAIELGAAIAVFEINQRGGVLGGRPLELVVKDNHGVSARARDNFTDLAQLKDLVAIYGGKFSPAILETMPLADQLKIVSVSLWGSANPITDDPQANPFVYRLSLKDKWAIPAMMEHARDAYDARRLCGVYPNTAWGRSGAKALEENLAKVGQELVSSQWYNWGREDFSAAIAACVSAGGQAVVLIANEGEAASFVNSMATFPDKERLPIVGHWGMTGGILHQLIGNSLSKVKLNIIQTFSFVDNPRPVAKSLAQRAMTLTKAASPALIASPVGVAQAYDMTQLMALAINKAGSTDRVAIRAALEELQTYDGAIRQYKQPFSATNHDALTAKQVVFVNIMPDGALIPIKTPNK